MCLLYLFYKVIVFCNQYLCVCFICFVGALLKSIFKKTLEPVLCDIKLYYRLAEALAASESETMPLPKFLKSELKQGSLKCRCCGKRFDASIMDCVPEVCNTCKKDIYEKSISFAEKELEDGDIKIRDILILKWATENNDDIYELARVIGVFTNTKAETTVLSYGGWNPPELFGSKLSEKDDKKTTTRLFPLEMIKH